MSKPKGPFETVRIIKTADLRYLIQIPDHLNRGDFINYAQVRCLSEAYEIKKNLLTFGLSMIYDEEGEI